MDDDKQEELNNLMHLMGLDRGQRREDSCKVEEFFRKNPKKSFCHIYCPCKRCTPWTL